MSTKEKILQKLDKIEDEATINSILTNIDLEIALSDEQPVKLSDSMKQIIDEGIEDVKQGKTLSHQQVQEKVTQWLNEQ